MMNTYCLKCKKQTKDLNSKGFITKNKKYIVKSICAICKSKKSKFICLYLYKTRCTRIFI